MKHAAICDANFFIALWNILATGKEKKRSQEPPMNTFNDILEQLSRGAERQESLLVTIHPVVEEIGHQTGQGLAIARLLQKYLDTEEAEPNEVFKEISRLNRRQVPPWFETGWGDPLIPERTDVLLLVLAKELAGEYQSVRMVTNDEGLQRAIRDLPGLMTFPHVTITEPSQWFPLRFLQFRTFHRVGVIDDIDITAHRKWIDRISGEGALEEALLYLHIYFWTRSK